MRWWPIGWKRVIQRSVVHITVGMSTSASEQRDGERAASCQFLHKARHARRSRNSHWRVTHKSIKGERVRGTARLLTSEVEPASSRGVLVLQALFIADDLASRRSTPLRRWMDPPIQLRVRVGSLSALRPEHLDWNILTLHLSNGLALVRSELRCGNHPGGWLRVFMQLKLSRLLARSPENGTLRSRASGG
jgi:hypothetical protein